MTAKKATKSKAVKKTGEPAGVAIIGSAVMPGKFECGVPSAD